MAEDFNLLAKEILKRVGGPRNIKNVTNCMTRLRINVLDKFAVNIDGIKKIPGVLQVINDDNNIQVVLGPGRVVKVAEEFNGLIAAGSIELDEAKREAEEIKNKMSTDNDWKANKALMKKKQNKFAWLSKGMKHLANIFSPLIPGIIAAGLFAALASIMQQTCGHFEVTAAGGDPVWVPINDAAKVFYNIFMAFSQGFTAYLVIFVGVNAAKEYGGSPMLGGFIGGICSIGNINTIALTIGLAKPKGTGVDLSSTLMAGKGGVIGVILAVWLLCVLERWLHKKMPSSIDVVATPFLCILLIGSIYVFGIMIVAGFVSDGIVWVIQKTIIQGLLPVKIIIGFIAAALFLPLVMTGMHHGLVAIYSVEFQKNQFVSLYPVLAMAGAGQVGAAIALYMKAKKMNNGKLIDNIKSSLLPGILGVGEPLIYSVTLPLGSPFITAGLGAGIGGAFVMAFGVASKAWGPSGLVAIPLMCVMNGKDNPLGMLIYTIGLLISIACGFVITYFFINDKKVMPKEVDPRELAYKK